MITTFIGHRKIQKNEILSQKLKDTILNLIDDKQVDTFLFGSRSEFNDLCLQTVTQLKANKPDIKRIYVRAEYPYINDQYKEYLLSYYDETYMPDNIANAGKAAYVERNQYMIDKSDICIFYYIENYLPAVKNSAKSRYLIFHQPNSGTKIAYEYAIAKKKEIINLALL